MLEPVPPSLNPSFVSGWTLDIHGRHGSAISREAVVIAEAASSLRDEMERSIALFGKKAAAITELRTLASEGAQEDWDGEGAHAVLPAAVQLAEWFVRAMPDGIAAPEFAVESDGHVLLDWTASRDRRLSLSIGENNRLSYAWLDGTDKGHGVAGFDGVSIPIRVLTAIESIVRNGYATFRVA